MFYRAVNTTASNVDDTKQQLYGSVTASEIAQQIRNSLSKTPETAKIPIDENSIIFRTESVAGEQRRLKEIGSFDIDVLIPGGESVSCVIQVVPDTALDRSSQGPKTTSPSSR